MSELVKPGENTTEWRAWLTTIAAAIAAAGGSVLASGLIAEGTVLYVIIGALVALAGVIGGASASYIKGRSAVKIAASQPPANP